MGGSGRQTVGGAVATAAPAAARRRLDAFVSSTASRPVAKPVCKAIVQEARLQTLAGLPGMQVRQALVGCQKRCANRARRRFPAGRHRALSMATAPP
jgi:hypothetical protein